jgi:hypothetical protein
MSTPFDPQAFLDAQITEVSVKRPPLPVGDYPAIIGDVTARAWEAKDGSGKSGIAWDIPMTIEIPAAVQAEMGIPMSTLNVKDSIMLDLTEGGMIDMGVGRNGKLRRYREACDLNKAGDVFSARKFTGCTVLVKIKHDLWEDNILEKVANVAKL